MRFPPILLVAAGLLLPPASPVTAALPGPAARVATVAKAAPAVRIDPTYWWVGLKNPKLQLLVNAPGIGKKRIVNIDTPVKGVAYDGATISSVQPLENPNYLIVNLEIAADARPGKLLLTFNTDPGDNKIKALSAACTYELRARNTDPQRTPGLTPADFVYMLMPDRFSNGDTKNDVVKGTRVNHVARDSMYARHGGDLKGIQNHFDYFKKLGVTTIWPTPVVENDMPRPATTATP